MKRFLYIFIILLIAAAAVYMFTGKRECTYKIDGWEIILHTNDNVSCRRARREMDLYFADQKRFNECVAAGGDRDACRFDTTTYQESPEPCETDMECYEKYGADCYIVRDVVFGDGNDYILEFVPEDEEDDEEEYIQHFSSLQAARDAASEANCMETTVASNCFLSSRQTCLNWNESWDASKDYVKWHTNNERRALGDSLLK